VFRESCGIGVSEILALILFELPEVSPTASKQEAYLDTSLGTDCRTKPRNETHQEQGLFDVLSNQLYDATYSHPVIAGGRPLVSVVEERSALLIVISN